MRHLACCGFQFRVLPDFWAVHMPHARSAAWEATLGDGAAAAARLAAVKRLYARACDAMAESGQAHYPGLRHDAGWRPHAHPALAVEQRLVTATATNAQSGALQRLLRTNHAAVQGLGQWSDAGLTAPHLEVVAGSEPASTWVTRACLLHWYELHFRYRDAAAQLMPACAPLTSAAARRATDVTVVCCASLDRLPQLRALCAAWAGTVSAAVLLPRGSGRVKRAARVAQLRRFHRSVEREGVRGLGGRLDMTVLRWDPSAAASSSTALFPINALRNAALAAARTDLVLILDVDLRPCANANRVLGQSAAYEAVRAMCCKREAPAAVVLPALEATEPTAARLREMVDAQPAAAAASLLEGRSRLFHVAHYPAGHRATDIDRWARAALESRSARQLELETYEVEHEEGFEPFCIVSRTAAQACSKMGGFDSRFRGYGSDKVTWASVWVGALLQQLDIVARLLTRVHGAAGAQEEAARGACCATPGAWTPRTKGPRTGWPATAPREA